MTITKIDCPKEWKSKNDWDSHLPLLWLALNNESGDVIEMGSGNGSTPRLDIFCHNSKRLFLSIEDNPENGFSPVYGSYIIRDGYIGIAKRWPEEFNILNARILFVDCAPGEIRKDLIEEWKDKIGIIIVHDTEESANYVYGIKDILSTFKYRLDYSPEYKPHTTAVSNFIDVTKWI